MKVIKAEDTRSLEPFRDRIIEGDCLEVMKSIPGESIDMILCDLPYGTTQNKWDSIIDLDLLFTEYMRIIKPHGAIVLTSSGLFTAKLMLHAHEIYKYKIVWVKSKATNFLNAKKQPLAAFFISESNSPSCAALHKASQNTIKSVPRIIEVITRTPVSK